MINWKVRIKNKTFWITLIPAIIMLIQALGNLFGLTIDLTVVGENLIEVVETLFIVLVILGVVNDPTTKGVSDSEQALTYEKPKE